MDDDAIIISNLNDFTFCPVSIYFHNLYGQQAKETFQRQDQLLGTEVHRTLDEKNYSTHHHILQGISCYSEKYHLVGKIDLFDTITGILTERKRTIKTIYDGNIFQLYAQYFCLTEMGYKVTELRLYSYTDYKTYHIKLPDEDPEMLKKFEFLIKNIRNFKLDTFQPDNQLKCQACIYEPACDRSLV